MYPELYQYLLLNKQLPVPGIGTFSLERTPARIDFPNKLMYPPVYCFSLQEKGVSPSGNFFKWLGKALRVSDRDAIIRFNDFSFDLKKQIDEGDIISWNGVGTLKKGLAGEIKFIPAEPSMSEDPVPAAKVLREKADHTVRVGEDEKTVAEMEEMLAHPVVTRSWWWVYAMIVGLLAFIFTGWYLSENGVQTGSVANTKKLVPAETAATYKALP